MPIKFRCSHCRQFLGISPSKAGELTDCPACGRTVRVPNLDGTVAPLPATRLDPADSQLADALTALSRIGEFAAAPGSGGDAVIATRAQATTRPPAAVAVPVQPPLPADRIAPAPASASPTSGEPPDMLFIPDDPVDEPVRVSAKNRRPRELRIAAVVLAAVALLLIGFYAGRAFERRTSRPSPTRATTPQPARPVARPQPAPAPAPVAEPIAVAGVAGTVTWETADGQTRNDGGARIIAFPAARPAQPTLAVAGFRAGAAAAERDRATAAIRDAGGDCAIADDTGRYALRLDAGRFDLLILSRHQPRDSTLPLDPRISKLLTAYFDQPSGLVGSVDVALHSVDFDGVSLRRDHAFSR